MIKKDEFIARKKLLNGQVKEVGGPGSYLKYDDALASLSPIAIGEVFELELGDSVRLPKVMPGLTFDCVQSDDQRDDHDEEWAQNVIEACDFESGSQDSIVRIAIARKGGAVWQLIGLPCGSDIAVIVQNPEDCYSASSRYFGEVIAQSSWGSEGYGINFEGGAALVEVDDYWVEAFDGDSLEPDRLVEKPSDSDSGRYLAGWLEEQDAILPAVVELFDCKWSDPDLRAQLDLLRPHISKVAPRLLLTQARTRSLKAALTKQEGAVGALRDILRNAKSDQAQKLVQKLREAHESQNLKTFLSVFSFSMVMEV